MRRPFLAFLLAAVLPAALAIGAGAWAASGAWRSVTETSKLRVARMALAAAEADAAAGLPPSVSGVARATGYRMALSVGGTGVAATDPPPPPAGVDGALRVSRDGADGRAYAVVVAPDRPPPLPIPVPLLLVTALVLLFASLAGWIHLAGRPAGGRAVFTLLLSALPALAAWGFLLQAERLYRGSADEAERRDLSRALAVARLRGVAGDPPAAHLLTGFRAWRVHNGMVASASTSGEASGIAALPAPPPSFTSTGSVTTPEGVAAYVALRLPDGSFAVVAEVPPPERLARFRATATRAGLALAAWLLVAGVAATVGGIRVSSGR